MPISSKSLSCIQQAGAAVYIADAELKSVVKEYAVQVQQAMLENPFDIENDGLFEEWKTVARLSLALEQIEVEFRKIYSTAEKLNTPKVIGLTKLTTIASPGSNASNLPLLVPIDATDVVIKRPKKSKAAPKVAKNSHALKGNSAKLLACLNKLLNPDAFTRVNRAEVGRSAGLATGSVGASITQLIKNGYLVEDASRGLKLVHPRL